MDSNIRDKSFFWACGCRPVTARMPGPSQLNLLEVCSRSRPLEVRKMSSGLTVEDYERIFRVLEHVERSTTLTQFRHSTLDALATEFGLRNTTCLSGPTFDAIFDDASPVLVGRMVPLHREYRAGWSAHDVFRLPEARARLERSAVLSVSELSVLPKQTRDYLDRWLGGNGIADTCTIHLRHRSGHSLIGLFTDKGPINGHDMSVLRVLGQHLSALGRHIPSTDSAATRFARLTPRQMEVVGLVAQGLTNLEIAEVLVLAEDSVKKHVSRILTETKCRSRTELTLFYMSRSPAA